MSENKTQPTEASVAKFLDGISDSKKQEDTQTIVEIMERVSGYPAKMWGESLIGFGQYTYTYKSGRTGEWSLVGVSPRARNISIYIMPGFDNYQDLMQQLGKFKVGRSCLYINKLQDVDVQVLETLIERSVNDMKTKYKIA
ncbi:MAG: DUF1801 domain-containing protein [Gammaproteobacteria bacterium]|nr:DUF1801 domain-containing protein [Gammaproteobacteria bacterium]MXX94911.1 DUF1801 domain-containing protein [Gammaproteobacteria bacterium]MYF53375.1 DUF1801 domain-containing protein [Gammaproteobacteria bacterium]MYK44103.1 DUF1801 domain-containing protein [Gammaproteobacteria bacterium]